MINKDRIVPIQAVDLISMYGLILLQDSENAGLTALEANNVEGDFNVASGSSPLIANEPVKNMDIASGVTSTIYFVAGYDYVGITVDGNAPASSILPPEGVLADGKTLYKAYLSSDELVIDKVGF